MKPFALIILVLASLSGCAAIERAGDWVNGNPLIASAATRQAITRYIEAEETPQAQEARAREVREALAETLEDLEGNPEASVDEMLAVLDSNIDWSDKSESDKALIRDSMLAVQVHLSQKQAEEQLAQDTVLAVRSLLRTAVSAASLFL